MGLGFFGNGTSPENAALLNWLFDILRMGQEVCIVMLSVLYRQALDYLESTLVCTCTVSADLF